MISTYEELFDKWQNQLYTQLDVDGVYELLGLVSDYALKYAIVDDEDILAVNLIISELCCDIEELSIDKTLRKSILNDFERTFNAENE